MSPRSSIFESFNARALNPRQVAATFVPSDQFRRLCRRCHTVVLGPRGSGKTTLLKMLQTPALEVWSRPGAQAYVDSVDFTGVFISTDISWSDQLALLGHGHLDDVSRETLSIASFTTHVLRSLVTAMHNRTVPTDSAVRSVRRVKNSAKKESKIVSELSRMWQLHGLVPDFSGLRQALSRRLLAIKEIANKEILLGMNGRAERLAQVEGLHLQFLHAAASGIEVFDDVLGRTGDRWGLLFDELEIAPEWIHEHLIHSMRSTDERFLFKLALNPFNPRGEELLRAASSPAPGQDFDQLALWYAEKRDAYKFCRELWNEMLRERGLPLASARDVLGRSEFEPDPGEWKAKGTAYSEGSRWFRRFKSLEAKDQSFRHYLRLRKISLDALEVYSGAQRAIELRKIAPVVAIRDFLLREKEESPNRRLRSRKSQSLYAGAESLFAISEGNPRWFIGLVKGLLDDVGAKSPSGTIPKIRPSKQAAEISKVAHRFAATLRSIPIPFHKDDNRPTDVLGFVEKVGQYFHSQAVKGDFKPEPAGSFVVDSRIPEPTSTVLIQALNAGAIVYVADDDGQLILTSLRGKRFRLSYLLAPLYNFPIRLGKAVALSSIMDWDIKERNEIPLFFEDHHGEPS